jgi:hypothetical protein
MVAQTQPQVRQYQPTSHASDLRGGPDLAAWQDYVGTVENCFLEIRGRGVHWSETDRARASAWYEMGLPAGATVRVLQARVQAWRFRHGANARLPMHLGWYEPAVLEHAKHLRLLGDAQVDPLLPEPVETPTLTVTLLLAELSGLIASNANQVLSHVYGKAFDWLDGTLQGAAPEVDPATELPQTEPPDSTALVEKCRARMNKLLVLSLDDAAKASLEQLLADDLKASAGLSQKARKVRQERVTERWLAAHFGHRVPTLTGWRDPRES